MKLPYAENAAVDIRKLRDYSLNLAHDNGKHKARKFVSALGMTKANADDLRLILLDVVTTHEATTFTKDSFGQRYRIDFMLEWEGKRAMVRSSWIIEDGSTTPRLTSCYVL